MTFLELQQNVLRRVGEPEPPSTAQKFHSLQDAKDAINEGVEFLAEVTEYYEVSGDISITANTLYFDLSQNSILNLGTNVAFLYLNSLFSNQNNRWLTPSFYRELDERVYPQWERSIGEPDWFCVRAAWWLGLYPHKTATSGTVTAHCAGIPAPMTADGDVPGIPEEFHEAIEHYAVYDLFCAEREWDKAKRAWALYIPLQERLKEFVQKRVLNARMNQFGGVI